LYIEIGAACACKSWTLNGYLSKPYIKRLNYQPIHVNHNRKQATALQTQNMCRKCGIPEKTTMHVHSLQGLDTTVNVSDI